jgi:glycosyltransferase involved in cell wall biosynthesis
MNSFSDGSGTSETATADAMDQKFIVILSVPEMPTSKAYGKALAHTRQAMLELGHRVVLVAPSSARETIDAKQAVDIDASDLIYRTLRRCINWQIGPAFTVAIRHYLSFKFKHLCKDLKPDMIWTRDVITATKLQRLRVPIVLEEHHVPSRRQKRRYRRLLRNLRSVSLVAISEPIRFSLQKLGSHEVAIMVEPSGVADEFFEITPAEFPATGTIKIGYLGSRRAYGVSQGVEELVALWPKVFELSEDLELTVFGWGNAPRPPDEKPKDSETAQNLYLLPAKPAEEVPRTMEGFDVLIAPYPEGVPTLGASPLKLSEYAGARRPILATNSSPVRNSLGEGMYQTFDLTDPYSLVTAVLLMRSHPESTRKMVDEAYVHVAERRWESRTSRILARLAS